MSKLIDIGSRVRSGHRFVRPCVQACCAQPSMLKSFVPRSRIIESRWCPSRCIVWKRVAALWFMQTALRLAISVSVCN